MALDLTTTVPRSPFDEIDGYAWLPRMLDKARAYFAGTHGEYSAYPCPGDMNFLKYFGIEATALGEVIKGGASDEAVAAYITEHTSRSQADRAAFAQRFHHPDAKWYINVALFLFKQKHKATFSARYPNRAFAEINSFARMLALEEGHPIPGF
jgi:hypothetical protein